MNRLDVTTGYARVESASEAVHACLDKWLSVGHGEVVDSIGLRFGDQHVIWGEGTESRAGSIVRSEECYFVPPSPPRQHCYAVVARLKRGS